MMPRILLMTAVLLAAPAIVLASEASNKLLDALGTSEMIALMRDEGVDYGDEIGDEMLPAGATTAWKTQVSRIYDTGKMRASVEQHFAAALEGVDLEPLQSFFDTEGGKQIVALELSARAALMDDAIEAAAKEQFRMYERANDDAFVLVDEFVEAGDLLEANVVGALNSNIMFYRGLVEGGVFKMSENEIIADVWSQETETRSETRDWLYAFLIMAYAPLEPGQLEAYTELSKTPEGIALTRALFAGFDTMYADISYALGLAAAREMSAEEI